MGEIYSEDQMKHFKAPPSSTDIRNASRQVGRYLESEHSTRVGLMLTDLTVLRWSLPQSTDKPILPTSPHFVSHRLCMHCETYTRHVSRILANTDVPSARRPNAEQEPQMC